MRIVLISMPWALFNRPSIQLSALQIFLRQQEKDWTIKTLHPYLALAAKIGTDPYRTLSESSWAGESLYYSLLFPEQLDQARKIFYRALKRSQVGVRLDFDSIRSDLDEHTDDWLRDLEMDRCSLAGFSVCFSQLPASLLAAQRLKQLHPDLPVVFGGSTCSPAIGASLLKTFPAIDYIVNGEGERPLLDLCRFIDGRTSEPGTAIQYRPHSSRHDHQACGNEIPDMNTLAVPVFADYFSELLNCGLTFIPELPIEFSRGCWWNKCAFCNLNLQWCGYRYKKSERVIREVELLSNLYQCLDFFFTDNALPPAEADRFFSAMAENDRDLKFFGEIRTANRPEIYGKYGRGGLKTVQAGIEAFSDSLLKRMNKGVTVMDNIASMKYAAEAGIKLDGNLILEFPGSTEEEVRETLRVLDYALFYRPLKGAAFFLGHGSPICKDPRRYGVKAVLRHPNYKRLIPGKILSELEVLVNFPRGDRQKQYKLWLPVRKKLRDWSAFHQNRKNLLPPLTFRDGGDFIIIRQESPGKAVMHHKLKGLSRKIYLACRRPMAIKTLLDRFNSVTEEQLLAFLDDLQQKRLLFTDGKSYLALALHMANKQQSENKQAPQ